MPWVQKKTKSRKFANFYSEENQAGWSVDGVYQRLRIYALPLTRFERERHLQMPKLDRNILITNYWKKNTSPTHFHTVSTTSPWWDVIKARLDQPSTIQFTNTASIKRSNKKKPRYKSAFIRPPTSTIRHWTWWRWWRANSPIVRYAVAINPTKRTQNKLNSAFQLINLQG